MFGGRLGLWLTAALAAAMTLPVSAAATDYPVTNTVDNAIAPPGSLRAAMSSAETHGGPDTITFTPNMSGTINLTSGLPTITQDLDIIGPTAGDVTVFGGDTHRIFSGDGTFGTHDLDLNISDLELRDGSAGAPPGGGGAIRVDFGDVQLSRISVVSSSATAPGGGVAALNSDLLVIDSSFIGNTSVAYGGGLYFDSSVLAGDLIVNTSTFSGNISGFGGGPAASGGGGIAAVGADTVFIQASTVSGNEARADMAPSGTGAGIYTEDSPVEIVSSTITRNESDENGGGLSLLSAPAELKNSIVAGNTAGLASLDINADGVVNPDFSLIGTQAGWTLPPAVTSNIVGVDPGLGPLQDNGGPTETHRPAFSSPAVDQGRGFGLLIFDQRGELRVFDSPLIPNSMAPNADGVDIGSVELTAAEAVPPAQPPSLGTIVTTQPPAAVTAKKCKKPKKLRKGKCVKRKRRKKT